MDDAKTSANTSFNTTLELSWEDEFKVKKELSEIEFDINKLNISLTSTDISDIMSDTKSESEGGPVLEGDQKQVFKTEF